MAKLFALLVILAVGVAAVDATRGFYTPHGGTFVTTKKRFIVKKPVKKVVTLKFLKKDEVDVTTVETTKKTPEESSTDVVSVKISEGEPEVVVQTAEVPEPAPVPEVVTAVVPEPAPEVPEVVPEVPEVVPEVPEVVPEVPEVVPEVPEVVPEVPEVVPEVPEVVPEVPEVPAPEVLVDVVPNAGTCEPGLFFVEKVEFKGCMECDAQCTGGCIDIEGCQGCAPGYFTYREDTNWPYECKLCADFVPGCDTCVNDVDLEAGRLPKCAA